MHFKVSSTETAFTKKPFGGRMEGEEFSLIVGIRQFR